VRYSDEAPGQSLASLTLNYEALALLADPDQVLVVYAAEAGSPSQDALTRLRDWAATEPGR
jgi:hypothetical protein